MPIAVKCDTTLGCTFAVWHGEVSLADWQANFSALLANPTFPPGPSWLVDLQTARSDLFDSAALEEMGERFNAKAERFGGMRLAAVPNGAWEKARQLLEHELQVPGLTSMQFATVDTACLWLGLPVSASMAILAELRADARDDSTGV